MGNKHEGSYDMNSTDARFEADSWKANGGGVRIDGSHQGNSNTHYHLYGEGPGYPDGRAHDFVINVKDE